jgi:hypothetical protein
MDVYQVGTNILTYLFQLTQPQGQPNQHRVNCTKQEEISLNPKPFYQGINHPIYGQRQDPPLYCSPSMSTITSPRAQDALGNQSCSRWNQEVDLNIFPFQSSSLNPSIGARAYEFPAVHTRRHCISAVGGNRGSLGIPKESARYTGTGGNLNPRFGQTLG